MNQQQRYFLELNQEGQIEGDHDKAIYVNQHSTVRVFIRNRKQGLQPHLILRKGYSSIDSLEGKTLKQIQQHHNTKSCSLDTSGDWKVDVEFPLSGAAYLRLCWCSSPDQIVSLGVENHIIVQPPFVERLQEITIQTLLPYCLGKFADYEQQIQSQVDLGYEAFHFPPIQQLGQSTSLYAIADQQKLNTDIFGDSTFQDLKSLFEKFPNIYFFIDILLNHTAFDSPWLTQPEFRDATYNRHNSPHLEAAIKLDCAIAEFSNKLGSCQLTHYPRNTIYNENDLNQVIHILEHDYVRKLNLHEYFQFNIPKILTEIKTRCPKLMDLKAQQQEENLNIFIKNPCETILEMLGKQTILKGQSKFGVSLNFDVICGYLNKDNNYTKVSLEYIQELLQYYNNLYIDEVESYIREAISSTKGQITWWKLTLKNPIVEVNEKGDSLVPRYFTKLSNGEYAANNGWIQGFDPLNNFAENQEHHYLRRTIVIWGDLVKLRYGHSKHDSPALWKYMKKYVQQMARIFHGLRLDNAHSTPLVVGEYMMMKARQANPNILVFAELFTGSPEKDSIFTKSMGINCLVRETNRCHNSGDLNRDLHYYCGDGKMSIGSLPQLQESFESMNEKFTILQPQFSPALIYEQSHDNESLISTHGYNHQLPIASLITFSNCMGGTVRGYDVFLPNRLSVVDERRNYSYQKPQENLSVERNSLISFRYDGIANQFVELMGSWNEWKSGSTMIASSGNIYTIKLQLPVGHFEYRFKVNGNWVNEANRTLIIEQNVIQQHSTMELPRKKLHQIKKELHSDYPYIFCQSHSDTIQSITRESQDKCKSKILITVPAFGKPNPFTVIKLPGALTKVDAIFYHEDFVQYNNNEQEILPSTVKIIQHNNIREFAEIHNNELRFVNIPSGFTVVLECTKSNEEINHIQQLEKLLSQNHQCFSTLSASEINYLLFMSEPEERDKSGKGLYFVPNYRQLIYAGFAGPRSATREAQRNNNLAHPICENLRNGNWLLDYLNDRVQSVKQEAAQHLNAIHNHIKSLPSYHIPSYFCRYVDYVYENCMLRVTQPQTSIFKRELQLASYQFLADLPSSKQMSAGLPHFTTGWARCWGRDTFISFRGIYLENKLFAEARDAILVFGSCLRHGLIPNLLDSGHNPRYNCRDACWWYIKAVKDYITYTGSYDILKEDVSMVFLDDDIDKHHQLKSQGVIIKKSVADIVQTIFQSHATGIRFREWRAGSQIDNSMQTEGFNIVLILDESTGFIVGGNWLNCLTWMDKMGSSEVNRGIPATSRDGAPIELTALLKVCLDFAINPQFPFDCVICPNNKKLLYKDWLHFLINNFEKQYYIPKIHDPNYHDYQIIEKHVRHRQIYKDIVKSSKPRNEYQLRCNASIAIGLAPELFTKEKAMVHLAAVELHLIRENSIGLKTLDPAASEYIHFYDNSDQSNIFNVSHGFSYHNGPEWVWVYGYFIKALVNIHGKEHINKQLFYSYLSNHKIVLHQNEWYSLPEMTNGNGEYNIFSCRAQAWSIACLLEALSEYE